ncbi:MAG: hypothetical protein GX786_09565 [Clostridiales bacterium]|nr:hypothetical protein [Clostridiales bacterium]
MENASKEKIWNVPNVLTMIRLALIPVYIYVFIKGSKTQALGVFLVASFTDLLDGQIARKYHLVTDFGKIADPLADKLMVTTVLLSQVVAGVLPTIAVILVAIKEALLLLGGLYLLRKKLVVPSKFIGKVAQVMFIASLFLSFFSSYFIEKGYSLHLLFLWISVGLSYCALFYYSYNAFLLIKQVKGTKAITKD